MPGATAEKTSITEGPATSERAWRAWWPVGVWLVVILAATSIPLRTDNWISVSFPLDKMAHFGLYAGLGRALARGLWRSGHAVRTALLSAFCGGTVFAALDELHQLWIPGREAAVGDWLADGLGLAVAICYWGMRVARHAEAEVETRAREKG